MKCAKLQNIKDVCVFQTSLSQTTALCYTLLRIPEVAHSNLGFYKTITLSEERKKEDF
jgi:hypothetical protein